MKRYDLQVHTCASPCSNMTPEEVVEATSRADLDGIAITDHDTVENIDRVSELAPPDLNVISGIEVTTTEGHLLGLGVDEPIPRAKPREVVSAIHDQGGLAVLSHPFDTFREYFDSNLELLASMADGVEVINSRCLRTSFNCRAQEFAEQNGLTPTGGSDAHFGVEVGRAVTVADGPVLEAIREGETTAVGRGRYFSGHIATKIHQIRSKL